MKFTSPYVNKASNWLIFAKGPIRGFVYIRACEFQYELLNFTTKFGTKFATFAEKLYEINCKTNVNINLHSKFTFESRSLCFYQLHPLSTLSAA